jgi:hypothetical protein
VIRQRDIVIIEGKEQYHWQDGRVMEIERKFHLLALDEPAAERVERQILLGERVHFGLDIDIFGMICTSGDIIYAINVHENIVRKICAPRGYELRLFGNPRHKLKGYKLSFPMNPPSSF